MGRYYKQNYIENVQIDAYTLPCECYVEVQGGGKVVYTHNGIKEITGIKNRKVRISGRLEADSYSDLLSQIKPIMALGKKTEALDISCLTTDAYGVRKIIIESEPKIGLIAGFDNSRSLSIEADEEMDEGLVIELLKEAKKLRDKLKAKIEGVRKTYRIKKGDSLHKIALREYGDFSLWKSIYGANKDIIGGNPNQLAENTELIIPALNPKEIEIKIQAGDTYASISHKHFYYSGYRDIIRSINESKELIEGELIKIPAILNIKKQKVAKKSAIS